MLKQKSKIPKLIKRVLLLALPVALAFAGLVSMVMPRPTALAATNSTINFQARLLTAAGNVVPDGVYNIEFKLYNVASGGTALWTETRTGTDKVTVKNGYLTVNLGSVTAFGNGINWDQELWLTMNIGGTGSPSWDGEMNPRLKLTSVPYAFRSGAVVSADGNVVLTVDPNDTSGKICVQNSANCGFLQGDPTDYIQNTNTPQTANINITSALNTSSAMTIQGATSANVPVAVIKGGATPGSAADVLQLQDSSNAVLFKVDNNGDAELARSLRVNYVSGVTNQLNIQGPSGDFVTVNSENNKFYIGDQTNCTGRFCVGYSLNGTGGASYTNAYNLSQINVSSNSTIIGQDIKIADTSNAVNNLIRGLRIDARSTTNASATLNGFQVFIPKTSVASNFGGNAIQVQQSNQDDSGAVNIFRITNTGQALFQSTNNTATAFQILNSGGNSMFTLNTNGTNNGIYIGGGTGSNGAGGRVFFGATGDSGVWIGEDGTTDTNILSLNGNSGLNILVNNTTVASFSSTGLDVNGTLRLSGTTVGTFTTPNGVPVGTKINIPIFDPGTSGQILALGLPAMTGIPQNTSARAISLFDKRAYAHQPTLAVFSPDENHTLGFSWDGADDVGYVKTTGNAGIGIRTDDTNIALFGSSGIDLYQSTTVATGKTFTVNGNLRSSNLDAVASGQIIEIGNTNAAGIDLNQDTAVAAGKTLTVSGTLRASTINAASSGDIIAIGTTGLGIDLNQDTAVAAGKKFTAQGSVTFQNSSDSTSAFRVLGSTTNGSVPLFTVDTSNSRVYVGNPTDDAAGALLVLDSKNTAGDPTGVNGSMYYNSSTNKFRCYEGSVWKDCIGAAGTGNGNGTLDSIGTLVTSGTKSVDGASVSGSQILMQTADQNYAGLVSADDQIFGGNKTFMGDILQKSDSASALTLKDSAGNINLQFSSADNHLKIYDPADTGKYADIYYSGSTAYFKASAGATQIGNGTGDVNISLTNNAERFNFLHTGSNATSGDVDFQVIRQLTGVTNNLQGAVFKVEDLSTFTSGSSSPDVLYVNQNNTAATGNLIVARLGGGSNDKFKVNTAGTVTIAAGQSYTSAGSVNYTGTGTVSLLAGASSALTLTGNAASTWSTTSGDLTIQAAGANALNLDTTGAGTVALGSTASAVNIASSASAHTINIGSGAAAQAITIGSTSSTGSLVLRAGTGNISITTTGNMSLSSTGDISLASSGGNVVLGASDATGSQLVLDAKTTAGDPASGVNGGMYYNSNSGKFRCYQNGAWKDCLSPWATITKSADESISNDSTISTDSELQFTMAANTNYTIRLVAYFDTTSAADFKYALACPTSPNLVRNRRLHVVPGATADTGAVDTTCVGNTTVTGNGTTGGYIEMKLVVQNGASAGTFGLQWAQVTNDAGPTTVRAGSYLEYAVN